MFGSGWQETRKRILELRRLVTMPRRNCCALRSLSAMTRAGRSNSTAIFGQDLMKTIMGELGSASGAVLVAGRDLTRMPTDRRVRLGLGYVPHRQYRRV